MDLHTRNVLRSVEKAVTHLATACRKKGPLYNRNPRAVAQINRTSKWLINAIRDLGNSIHQPMEGTE